MERRILILSCFTGEGHNSAARAMHSAFDALEVPSRIMDPVSFQGKHAQHFISSFYNGMIRRSPGAFGALYKAGALYDATGWVSPVYLANAAYAERLNRFLEAQRYTDVVCTHLYGMEAMTALKKRGKSGSRLRDHDGLYLHSLPGGNGAGRLFYTPRKPVGGSDPPGAARPKSCIPSASRFLRRSTPLFPGRKRVPGWGFPKSESCFSS